MGQLTCVLFVALLALAAVPAAASAAFTLDPSDGALAGVPGQELGWGLTIQNDDSGWLVIDSVTFDQTTSIGDFTDLLSPQFFTYALPPDEVWTQAFAASTSSGLGSYVIDGSFANPGDMAIGNLDLIYDVFSQDPNSPTYDPFTATENAYEALLPATVTYQSGPATPEPASIATTLIGLAVLALGRTARRRT